jgi:hypothetical protein
MAEALAGEGVIFFAVGYPRSSPPVPFSEHGLGARAMADSVGCAIRFARIRASELGSDDPVVVLSGFSLGGAPAAHAAMFGADLEAAWEEFAAEGGPPGQVACEVTGGSTHVDALVGMSGAYDVLAPIYDGKWGRSYQQEHDPELGSFLASAIGANPSLKVRLLHGEADGWIPYDNSTGFAAALADAGYDVEMIGFAGGHGEPPPEIAVPIIMDVAR